MPSHSPATERQALLTGLPVPQDDLQQQHIANIIGSTSGLAWGPGCTVCWEAPTFKSSEPLASSVPSGLNDTVLTQPAVWHAMQVSCCGGQARGPRVGGGEVVRAFGAGQPGSLVVGGPGTNIPACYCSSSCT